VARFEVDVEGMKELQGGRDLWRLVKELPVNVFDECARDDVVQRPTVCHVTANPIKGRRAVRVTVEDDGQGFQHLEDAYTLFRSTPKRGQPEVAGRFNMGEKEIMALAYEGRIETTSGTVEFPRSGDRKVSKRRKRAAGTYIALDLPAKVDEIQACVTMLRRLVPPLGLRFTVNGEEIGRPQEIARTQSCLNTVIQTRPGEPLKTGYRTTDIVIYEPADEGAWLFELGCPVQRIEAPYSADVRQKVPMPPERDTVSNYFLQDIYAAVLNATVDLLTVSDTGEDWMKQALEDSDTRSETVQKAARLRFGDKVVLWSSNPVANEEAIEAGYVVVPPQVLSKAEREGYKRAGFKYSSDEFGVTPVSVDEVKPDEDMLRVAAYARALARHLVGLDGLTVRFYRLPRAKYVATYRVGLLSFNVATLPRDFFGRITADVTDLILHELGHHGPDGEDLPHGRAYVNRLSALGARLFHIMLEDYSDDIAELKEHLRWTDQRGKKKAGENPSNATL